jgi:hypothetical protein
MGLRIFPAIFRPIVDVLGQRGVGILSGIMGFIFFSEFGYKAFGFILLPATEPCRSTCGVTAAVFFLTLPAVGVLYRFEADNDIFCFPVLATFWRCRARASWMHLAASSRRFPISSSDLPSADVPSDLPKGTGGCCNESASTDELLGTPTRILSTETGLDGQEEIS